MQHLVGKSNLRTCAGKVCLCFLRPPCSISSWGSKETIRAGVLFLCTEKFRGGLALVRELPVLCPACWSAESLLVNAWSGRKQLQGTGTRPEGQLWQPRGDSVFFRETSDQCRLSGKSESGAGSVFQVTGKMRAVSDSRRKTCCQLHK